MKHFQPSLHVATLTPQADRLSAFCKEHGIAMEFNQFSGQPTLWGLEGLNKEKTQALYALLRGIGWRAMQTNTPGSSVTLTFLDKDSFRDYFGDVSTSSTVTVSMVMA